ncbi:hypothetical protein Tco_0985097 [Tanacetum coccineum]
MMNDEIKESTHYVTYLAVSTNFEVTAPKVRQGKGKGQTGKKKPDADVQKEKKKAPVKKKTVTPRKKSSLTANDNILPDPDEAKKLAKSISLTEEKHQEEEHLLHDTHEHLVTKRESDSKEEIDDDEVQPLVQRRIGVEISREVPKKPTSEEALDHSQKLKDSDNEIEDISSDEEIKVDEAKDDEKMKDVKNDESEKAEEQPANNEQAGDEEPVNDQAEFEQARSTQANVDVPKPAVPNPSSSLTLSSAEYGNQFLNISSDTSLVGILKEHTKVEIQSIIDVHIHQEDPNVQRTPLIDTVVSMITYKTTPTTTPTPPTTQAQVTKVSESYSTSKFEQRILELEKKVKALSKSGSTPKGKTQSKTSSTDKSMNEEETVHDAAMEADQAMDADEDEVANVEEYPQDDATSKQDKSTWFKQPPRPKTPNPEWHKDLTVNDGPEQSWFNDLVNAEKDPLTFD